MAREGYIQPTGHLSPLKATQPPARVPSRSSPAPLLLRGPTSTPTLPSRSPASQGGPQPWRFYSGPQEGAEPLSICRSRPATACLLLQHHMERAQQGSATMGTHRNGPNSPSQPPRQRGLEHISYEGGTSPLSILPAAEAIPEPLCTPALVVCQGPWATEGLICSRQ